MIAATTGFTGTITQGNAQYFAVTRHFDPEYANNTITSENQLLTVSIVDGFGSPVQVKKTHFSGSLKWIVSGFETKDAFGRTTKSYLTTTEPGNYPASPQFSLSGTATQYFNAPPSALAPPVEMQYDAKDRVTLILQPGESQAAQVNFQIENGMLVQNVTNELSQTVKTFTDVRGRKRKTVQNEEISTHFDYSAVNELMKVTDSEGFSTNYKYDLAGRKTEVQHPDRGVQTFKYNKVGNIIEHSNSNLLLNQNQKITYTYDFGRLVRVEYPQFAHNKVEYTYGEAGDPLAEEQNAVGRILYQVDATGLQVFTYGRMGEIKRNLRSVAVAGYQSYWFFTQWKYDSWNRLQEIEYPDEELVRYHYNTGGTLQSVTNHLIGNNMQPVVSSILYNDYGERQRITYGNGNYTLYDYDQRRRMNVVMHDFASFDITKLYQYDVLSNITGLTTDTPESSLPQTGQIGGPVTHNYTYDNYNRLTAASGEYTGANDYTEPFLKQHYSLNMEYNPDHTIKRKFQRQVHGTIASFGDAISNPIPVQKNSYNIEYDGYGTGAFVAGPSQYGYTQPHAVRKITERPSWIEDLVENDPRIKYKEIKYDANGNMIEITEKSGEEQISLRKYLWDEENRLQGVKLRPDDPRGSISVYTYDASGQRTVRYNWDKLEVFNNSATAGQHSNDNVMLYPSGLVMGKATHSIENGERTDRMVYTKHYYIGSERISAKTGTIRNLGFFPKTAEGSFEASDITNFRQISNQCVINAGNLVKLVYNKFQVTPPVFNPVIEGEGFDRHLIEKLNYYYFHPDHLGSSSYFTNKEGEVTQHMEYLPFGETLVDEHQNSFNSPFKYNGKEFDAETGNYYYGERYYDPKWSIWLGVDPLVEKTGDAYGYCYQNPINFVDPNGLDPTPFEAALMAANVYNNMGHLEGGWQQSALYGFNINNEKTGLKGTMYERIQEDGIVEYAYVFAGTEELELDGVNDLTQVLGASSQYLQARHQAILISQYIGRQKITFVGHSLGGGLANHASSVTGRSSITFNPAWLSRLTKESFKQEKLKKGNYQVNYVHESDPLDRMQVKGGAAVGLESSGSRVTVNGGFFTNIFTGHLIGTMIERMRANGQNTVHTGNKNDKLIHATPRKF